MYRLALLLLLVLALPARAADVSSTAARTGAETVDRAWATAMKANDLDAIVACYATDATLWMPGGPRIVGTAGIRQAFVGMLADNTVQDVVLHDTHYENSGNLSAGWGEFTITIAHKTGGESNQLTGHFTSVAMKRGGKWVYVVDHASHEAMPEGAH